MSKPSYALINIAQKYWEMIEAYSDLPSGQLPTRENSLGCGSWGCAWMSGDPRYVIKISRDPTEGPTVAAIQHFVGNRQDSYPGLAIIKAVWRLPEKMVYGGKSRDVYAVVREAVQPLDYLGYRGRSNSDDYIIRETSLGLTHLRDYVNAGIEYKQVKRNKAWYFDKMRDSAVEMYNYEPTYYIAAALEELLDAEITLTDIHQGNIGYRLIDWDTNGKFELAPSNSLLIFDFGHSTVQFEVPVLGE